MDENHAYAVCAHARSMNEEMALASLALLYCLVLLPPSQCNALEYSHPVTAIQGALKSLEMGWKGELESLLGSGVGDAEFTYSCGALDFPPGCRELDSQGEGERAFLAISKNQVPNFDTLVSSFLQTTFACEFCPIMHRMGHHSIGTHRHSILHMLHHWLK